MARLFPAHHGVASVPSTPDRGLRTLIAGTTGAFDTSHMDYQDFLTLRAQGKIQAGIENSVAIRLVEHLPARYQAAFHFWFWVGVISVPGFILLGYFVNWYLGIGLLAFITPTIFSATKKSAADFVLEHAQTDRQFFEQLTALNVLIFQRT